MNILPLYFFLPTFRFFLEYRPFLPQGSLVMKKKPDSIVHIAVPIKGKASYHLYIPTNTVVELRDLGNQVNFHHYFLFPHLSFLLPGQNKNVSLSKQKYRK